MRIVAGRFKGKTLDAPKGMGTRPTTDRVREALFNVLTHGAPEIVFDEMRALDLFAGSGALGLEALSRGARFALFIEEDAGFVGLSWKVYVCIQGHDRWRVYDGRCRVARPTPRF